MERQGKTGFTLIELMVTVAVVGILAAIAYPSYLNQIMKTRRSDGKAALMSAAAKQEQYYLDNKTYTASMTALGFSADPAASLDGYYQVSVMPATAACPIASCFSLQAIPQSSQANDSKCGTFTLNQLGTKGITGTASVKDCW